MEPKSHWVSAREQMDEHATMDSHIQGAIIGTGLLVVISLLAFGIHWCFGIVNAALHLGGR